MKDIHETQPTKELNNLEDDKIITPIEDLQRIEGGGAFKRSHLNLKTLPKGIRWIGYFIIGLSVVTGILILLFGR